MKKLPPIDLIQEMRDFFRLSPYMPIMTWISNCITYADEVSAEREKADFSEYPYQVEVLKQWEDIKTRKRVVVASCEQMRKD